MPTVLVFDGPVTLSASHAPPPIIPWQSPWTVRIDFSVGFSYQGGDLCIEIEGAPRNSVAGSPWFVDFDQEADAGTVVEFGTACGIPAASYEYPTMAWGRNMVPGGTFSITSFGLPGSVGVLMLAPQRGAPVSLAVVGAPGCTLHVTPLIQVANVHEVQGGRHGLAPMRTRIHLPRDPQLLGASFAAQAANLEGSAASNPLGLTMTNGLDIALGGRMPLGAVTTLNSDEVGGGAPWPAVGCVSVSRGPVLELELR